MKTVVLFCQVVIALSIFNVWVLRLRKPGFARGGDARNMREEFAVYGFPEWFMRVIGIIKLSLAALLIAGIWMPRLTQPAALGMAALMLGAVLMHLKVKDPLLKSLPALTLLLLSLVVAFL